jgi:hypothetical protein
MFAHCFADAISTSTPPKGSMRARMVFHRAPMTRGLDAQPSLQLLVGVANRDARHRRLGKSLMSLMM